MNWWSRGNWRDRPLNILWLAVAGLAMYSLSRLIWSYDFMPMPVARSLATTQVMWRWLIPIVVVGGAVLILMAIVRRFRQKTEDNRVIVEPPHGQHGPQHYQQHGPF